jgi:hypothetical protein
MRGRVANAANCAGKQMTLDFRALTALHRPMNRDKRIKGASFMKKLLFLSAFILLGGFLSSVAVADDTLVAFKGGIGVVPVANVSGTANANGSFPDVTRNIVLGVNPGGFPWVIKDLDATRSMGMLW